MRIQNRRLINQECRPFLRWAGSKRRLLPILKAYWNSRYERYLEPFAGSAYLFFAIRPQKAILGDLNRELIATFVEVKYRLGGVLRELGKYAIADKNEYARLRSLDPARLFPHERAARFIYLNRFCFNGIYRTNLKGQFNVPYSGVGCGSFPNDDAFRRCSRRLQAAKFISGDFDRVLTQARSGDFVYMDPPFAVRARRVFREYNPATFGPADIHRLRSWMERLNAISARFVVSYAESEESDILRKGFAFERVAVRRNVAGFAAHRVISNEIVISNA